MPKGFPETSSDHDDRDQFRSPPTENPVADQFNIVVSVPQSIRIRMVNASALGDYEIWVVIASILSNAVVGFVVAYLQAIETRSANATNLGWSALLFVLLFVIAGIMAIGKRVSLSRKGKDIRLRTSSATVTDREDRPDGVP